MLDTLLFLYASYDELRQHLRPFHFSFFLNQIKKLIIKNPLYTRNDPTIVGLTLESYLQEQNSQALTPHVEIVERDIRLHRKSSRVKQQHEEQSTHDQISRRKDRGDQQQVSRGRRGGSHDSRAKRTATTLYKEINLPPRRKAPPVPYHIWNMYSRQPRE